MRPAFHSQAGFLMGTALFFLLAQLPCQDAGAGIAALPASAEPIPIVIPSLRYLGQEGGSAVQMQIHSITTLLRSAVSNKPNIKVLEREMTDEMYNEIAFQVTGIGNENFTAGRIEGAKALLFGELGSLFGRIVIATRLVNLETGQVLFANTIYVEEADIKTDIDKLANSIEEKALQMAMRSDIPSIKRQLKAKNYAEAKRLIDIFVRDNKPNAEILSMKQLISDGLSLDYYKQARGYMGSKLFKEARVRLSEALALRVDERFYALRRKIDEEEARYNLHIKGEELKLQASLERQRRGLAEKRSYTFSEWAAAILVNSAHIGASYAMHVDPVGLGVSALPGSWGGQALWLGELRPGGKAQNQRIPFRWTSYAAASAEYVLGAEGNRLMIEAYASPFLSESFKVLNIILSLGLDAGGMLVYGGSVPGDYALFLTSGASALLDIKFSRSSGIYLGARAGYAFNQDKRLPSAPFLRFYAGIGF